MARPIRTQTGPFRWLRQFARVAGETPSLTAASAGVNRWACSNAVGAVMTLFSRPVERCGFDRGIGSNLHLCIARPCRECAGTRGHNASSAKLQVSGRCGRGSEQPRLDLEGVVYLSL